MQTECHTALSPDQAAEWQGFLAEAAHQHPRQDPRFAAVERGLGRDVVFAIGRREGRIRAVGLFSLRRHPFLPGAHAGAQCLSGPVAEQPADVVGFLDEVRQHPAFARVGSIRVTPFWTGDDIAGLEAALQAGNWQISDSAPRRQTGWVDVRRSDADMAAGFSKSARRELRRAERQGIVLRPVTDRDEAGAFLDSLNRLRAERHLPALNRQVFADNFAAIHGGNAGESAGTGDLGVLIGAFHEGRFLSGLLLYRGRNIAHGRHFTTEPAPLRALSNLRIAPLLWREGMIWARDQGCRALDVEGYRADLEPGDKMYNVYKYKAELAPEPVERIAEHGCTVAPLVHLTGNGKALLKARLKSLLGRG